MITVTQQVGNATEEILFQDMNDYALYLLLTGSIEKCEFLDYINTLVTMNALIGDRK